MNIKTETSVTEQVRQWKLENAAEHDFDLVKIVQAARRRQNASGRQVIRLNRDSKSGPNLEGVQSVPEC